jgi:hypothetical protein
VPAPAEREDTRMSSDMEKRIARFNEPFRVSQGAKVALAKDFEAVELHPCGLNLAQSNADTQ